MFVSKHALLVLSLLFLVSLAGNYFQLSRYSALLDSQLQLVQGLWAGAGAPERPAADVPAEAAANRGVIGPI